MMYIPVSFYICTLTRKCVDIIGSASGGINSLESTNQDMVRANKIKLSTQSHDFILDLIQKSSKQEENLNVTSDHEDEVVYVSNEEPFEDENNEDNVIWMDFGRVKLRMSDKEILLNAEGLLNDKHIKCAQYLVKSKFPNVCGLRSTLQQQKQVAPLEPNSLQIIHLPGHWIAASTMNLSKEDIIVYDSLSTKVSENTAQILAQLVHTSNPQFTVKAPNVTKQSGSYECGLFAIAYITHLAHGLDPSLFVFHQEAMRNHFIQCIESQSITPFPTIKKRRQSVMANTVVIDVYCYCRCPDDGSKMVLCDGACGQWYHLNCLKQDRKGKPMLKTQKWYCRNCIT